MSYKNNKNIQRYHAQLGFDGPPAEFPTNKDTERKGRIPCPNIPADAVYKDSKSNCAQKRNYFPSDIAFLFFLIGFACAWVVIFLFIIP